MNLMGDMRMYPRSAWGLQGFLRHTITLEEAQAIVRQRLEEREANFLRLVEGSASTWLLQCLAERLALWQAGQES